MPFITLVKTDYGHEVKVLVEEYDEVADTTTVVDLSGFTDKILIIKKPDGVVVTVTGVAITDGTDGWYQATISQALGIFDQVGYYEFQGLLRNTTQQFHTSKFGEDIDINLDA